VVLEPLGCATIHRCRRTQNHGPDGIRANGLASRLWLKRGGFQPAEQAPAKMRAISDAEADFAQASLIGNQEIFDQTFLLPCRHGSIGGHLIQHLATRGRFWRLATLNFSGWLKRLGLEPFLRKFRWVYSSFTTPS